MLGLVMLRGALLAFATLFGSLGVFFLYFSFLRPTVAVYAVVFLATASAIVWFSPQR
jgi:hypothetical protein